MTGPEHLFDEPITVWRRSGSDLGGSGDPNFGSPQTVPGRWIETTEIIADADGRERRSTSSCMVALDLVDGDMVLRGASTAANPYDTAATPIIQRQIARRPHGGLSVRRYFVA